MKIELNEEELRSIVGLISESSVPVAQADKAIALFNRLKEALNNKEK